MYTPEAIADFKRRGVLQDIIKYDSETIAGIEKMKVERLTNAFGELYMVKVAHLVGEIGIDVESVPPVVKARAYHDLDWLPKWALDSFGSHKAALAYAAAALERHMTDQAKAIKAKLKQGVEQMRSAA